MTNKALSKNISLLAAYTKSGRVIGAQGKIPWNLPSERQRFKAVCKGKKVIMGRKTFAEIGKALSYCTIIIVSRTMKVAPEGCLLAKNLEQAFDLCDDEILIAGGQELYIQTLPYAKTIYATEIHLNIEGDTFFPELDSNWKKVTCEEKSDNGIQYDYILYRR